MYINKEYYFRKGRKEISLCPYYIYLPNTFFSLLSTLLLKQTLLEKKFYFGWSGLTRATMRFLIKLTNIFFICFMHRWIPIYFLIFGFLQSENYILFIPVLQSTIQFVPFGRYKPETTVSANAMAQLRKN